MSYLAADPINPLNNIPVTGELPSDFIQKLYKLIQDPSTSHLTFWSPNGDSFIITDPHDFAKTLLPLHFKHNNFQSFIRQLNKYGFSKVKREEDTDKKWEFKHTDFHRDYPESLYSIKRKLPCTRRIKINDIENTQNNSTSPTFPNQSNHHIQAQFDQFQSQIDHLTTHLSQSVQVIIEEMDHLNQWKAQSDAVLNQLTQLTQPSPNLLSILDVLSGFQRGYYERRTKLEKIAHSITALPMNKDISHVNSNSLDIPLKRESNDEPLAASIDTPNTSEGPKPKRGKTAKLKKLHEQVKQQQREMQMQKRNESLNAIPEGGHLASSVNSLNSALPPSAMNTNIAIAGANLQRPRNQMEPPKDIDEALAWTWTVPPNVLLVDDDPICRDMYSKCLQKLGCSFDIAADGAEAVNKMHTRKYDMVLMDIWMPQMDGLSATTIIRQFDQQTPIIAITGDYRETDKGFYLGQGINEVLGKPFKIDQLGECMQKHWVRFCIDRRNPVSSSMANQNPAFNVGNNFMNGMDQGFVMGSETSIPIDHQGQSYSDGVRGLGS